jgi:hypothetical protein
MLGEQGGKWGMGAVTGYAINRPEQLLECIGDFASFQNPN